MDLASNCGPSQPIVADTVRSLSHIKIPIASDATGDSVGTGDSVETGDPVGTGAPDAAGGLIFLTGEPLQGLRQGLRRNSPAGGSSVLTLGSRFPLH